MLSTAVSIAMHSHGAGPFLGSLVGGPRGKQPWGRWPCGGQPMGTGNVFFLYLSGTYPDVFTS